MSQADPRPDFHHVQTWVFDLDNTLYDPSIRLFDQISAKMIRWVAQTLQISAEEANVMRRAYWAKYGTTLAGLMAEHGLEPDPFLEDVHDIDFSVLRPDPALNNRIAALPGRRIVYTNATASYARRVLEARGLSGHFDAVYGVQEAGYHPKPRREAFDMVFALDRLDPTRAAMFEDDDRNLLAPHALGMRTVHVGPAPEPGQHIQYQSPDLSSFLARLTGI